MTNPVFTGYLEDAYLDAPTPYLGGNAQDFYGMQINRVIMSEKDMGMQVARFIENFEDANGMEVNRVIADDLSLGLEIDRVIVNDSPQAMEVKRVTARQDDRGFEVNRVIVDYLDFNGQEIERIITSERDLGVQTKRKINFQRPMAMQVERHILDYRKPSAMEIRRSRSFPHISCEEGGYLEQAYLEGPYLTHTYCVHGPMQVARTIHFQAPKGMQVERIIKDDKSMGMEIKRIIANFPYENGMQVDRLRAFSNGMQIRRVLYNVTNLRIMCDFASRGATTTGSTNGWGNPSGTGQNWVSTSTASGDFDPNNLNTDIVEQRTQTVDGVTSATFSCDTEINQGVAIDTFAILDHNLTSSAVITLEGSDNGAFSPVGISIPLTWTEGNIWYLAPTFPTQQFRYYQIVVSDPTNPDNYLRMGTIVFGTSTILQGECFVDQVRRRQKHFADKVATEGFTNVSNDRALKTAVGLEFRNIVYNRGNYVNLRTIFQTARTSLKCLWIPDPQDPVRFGVFAKLSSIPDETHNNMGRGTEADTVDFSLEVDESL